MPQFSLIAILNVLYFSDMLNMINLIAREDIKSRQVPRFYGYWAVNQNNHNSWKLLSHKRSYPDTTACEQQHPFVCERPAAALEGPEFKGKFSFSMCYQYTY